MCARSSLSLRERERARARARRGFRLFERESARGERARERRRLFEYARYEEAAAGARVARVLDPEQARCDLELGKALTELGELLGAVTAISEGISKSKGGAGIFDAVVAKLKPKTQALQKLSTSAPHTDLVVVVVIFLSLSLSLSRARGSLSLSSDEHRALPGVVRARSESAPKTNARSLRSQMAAGAGSLEEVAEVCLRLEGLGCGKAKSQALGSACTTEAFRNPKRESELRFARRESWIR